MIHHIQTMFFILNYLLSQNFFNEEQINNYDDIQDVVINCELILKNNWFYFI